MADPTSPRPDRKTCCKCKVSKPLDCFANDRQAVDGLQRRCRECKAAEHRARYANGGKEKQAATAKAWREANRERVAENNRRWVSENRDVVLGRRAEYRAANADQIRGYRAANRDARNEYQREWRRTNPERARELARESARRQYAKDPARAIERARRRRALILGRAVGPVDLEQLWASQHGLCGLCTIPIDRSLSWPEPMSPSVDHVVPLVKGGTHEQSNLQWTHLVCNIRKGAQAP